MLAALFNRPADAEELYAKFILAVGVLFLWLELAYLVSAQSLSFLKVPIDATGYAVGRDFIEFWMGGRSAFAGGPAAWFDAATFNIAIHDAFGLPDFPVHYWSYPPQIILFIWPLGLMPYFPAYLVWCAVGLALYMLAAWSSGVPRRRFLFLAVAPGVAVNIFFGQNGFLTGALLIGGLANLDRRPIVSGVCFGILTFKPQFGMLIPLMLVISGRWRVIAAAAASAAVLVAATSLWFGNDIWFDYVRKVMPQQHGLLIDAGNFNWPMMASAFVNARRIGLPVDAAWAVQVVTSCCAVAIVVWAFWRRRDPVLSNALFVTATFLFSPWMQNYDMVVFGWVVALLRERTENTPADHALALAVWTLPLIMMPLGLAHIPVTMLVLPAFAGRLVWRLAAGQSRRRSVGHAPVALTAALAAKE